MTAQLFPVRPAYFIPVPKRSALRLVTTVPRPQRRRRVQQQTWGEQLSITGVVVFAGWLFQEICWRWLIAAG